MSVHARIARGGALAAWAFFFLLLWTTGATSRYLGSRTQWVVPFGAVVLTLALLAYAYSYARARRSGPALTLREAVSLFALLVPLAAVILVPHAALGSFAAARKGGGTYFLSARPPPRRHLLTCRSSTSGSPRATPTSPWTPAFIRVCGFACSGS